MTENRIQKLSPLLINQISAGEVVTRPASVVKELLENAIDAGATRITVHIEQGGIGLIQVADNGRGIHPDDMLLAVTRHATSKLADVEQLTGIHSLGFRGEALASISAVSHFTLTSSHTDSGIGQQISLSGVEVSQITQADIRPVVKSQGTTVTVRDLYFNVPARRANLKSIATEFAQIEQVVQRIAISFADVGIQLFHQNKLRLSLEKQSSKKPNLQRLEQALNQPLQDFAIPFELSLNGLQQLTQENANITGWLFLTAQNHELPKLIYINQRLVTDLAISQTIAKSARQAGIGTEIDGVNLGYALFFELPVDWINVNIHPSKQQVKIQPLTNMLALLNQALQDLLKKKLPEKLEKIASPFLLNENDENAEFPIENQPSFNPIFPTIFSNKTPKNSANFPRNLQVNERKVEYKFANFEENQTHFNPEKLFDELPKFLKIIEKSGEKFGLIFWKDNFYCINIKMLSAEIVSNLEAFKLILQQSKNCTTQALISHLLGENYE